jgi:hypothetical protein
MIVMTNAIPRIINILNHTLLGFFDNIVFINNVYDKHILFFDCIAVLLRYRISQLCSGIIVKPILTDLIRC